MSFNKALLVEQLELILQQKATKLEHLIEDTRRSNNDTKSSMGDKYETGREMLQQQINQLQQQLHEHQLQLQQLSQLPLIEKTSVGLGSYVRTTQGTYFISVSAGLQEYQNQKIYAVSDKSPIAQALMNLEIDTEILFNKRPIRILEIL